VPAHPVALDDEDLDRPMPVVTAVPGPVIPRQAAPVGGGTYAQDDWRSHVAPAPANPGVQRGTVYGTRTVPEDTPGVAEEAASTV
jgi:hypothetical protein